MTQPLEHRVIRDRERLEAFLRRDAGSHIYALADLDDFFWPRTTWFGAAAGDELRAVCLLLGGLQIPVLYAVCPEADGSMRDLLAAFRPRLPALFFVNLGLGLGDAFPDHVCEKTFEYVKMELPERGSLEAVDSRSVEALSPAHLDELRMFYAHDAYTEEEQADRFFEPYMLDMGPYVGVREDGRLVAAGGVHVRSQRYGVAALGNIATAPGQRGRGLGRAVTAALCKALGATPHVGLNVEVDNTSACRLYQSLGFRPVRRYLEGVFRRN